jgi:hypothetical protein
MYENLKITFKLGAMSSLNKIKMKSGNSLQNNLILEIHIPKFNLYS